MQYERGAGAVPTVFVADDDDVFRHAVSGELRSIGYHVVEASNGADALEVLAAAADGLSTMPDLVVLDVCMPEFSGLGVLGVMRRFAWKPPTFLVTGFADDSIDLLAERRGAVRVFHKPIELDELIAAVREAVDAPAPVAPARSERSLRR